MAAPILFIGGAIARAAESSSEAPTNVSVSYTDAGRQPVNGGDENAGSSGNTDTSGNSVEQTLVLEIHPGPLTVSPSSQSVSFSKAHGNGGPMASSLSTVTVVDARGSLVGWDATVSLQSVNGVNAADMAKAKLCVSPDAVTVVAGNPPEVKSGKHVCGAAGDALTLFYAPPNGGGGTFSDTAGLKLTLPHRAGASPVTATLALAVH